MTAHSHKAGPLIVAALGIGALLFDDFWNVGELDAVTANAVTVPP